jgi:hypothetical protein
MPPLPGPPAAPDDTSLALLTITYPAFTITCHTYGWRQPRWQAVRKNPADPGLYAIITPDLDELHATLAATTPQPTDTHDEPPSALQSPDQAAPARPPGNSDHGKEDIP